MRTLGRPCDRSLITVTGARILSQCSNQLQVWPGVHLWPLQISEYLVDLTGVNSEFSQETGVSFPQCLEGTGAHRRRHNRMF